MVFNSKSKKNVVGELSQKMLSNCPEIYIGELIAFSINFLDFSESHCNGNG